MPPFIDKKNVQAVLCLPNQSSAICKHLGYFTELFWFSSKCWHSENRACVSLEEAHSFLDFVFLQSAKCPVICTSSPTTLCACCVCAVQLRAFVERGVLGLSFPDGRKEAERRLLLFKPHRI